MNDYREVRIDITPCTEDGTDVMAYLLSEAGFESFVPDEKGLTAYVREQDYDAKQINNALMQYPFAASLEVSTKFIEGKDWNSEWEKNYFQPIVVGDRCVIHSTFHTDIPEARYRILIDPKMAFGTGHHATTSQILTVLLDTDLEGKAVTDMGTGTGILAILAAMRGAASIYGIEIDEFAYTNALENVRLNGMDQKVTILNGDVSKLDCCPDADVFLANINRNVITADAAAYVSHLNDGAMVVFSGFYTEDIPVITDCVRPLGLVETGRTSLNNWACLIMKYHQAK